MAHNRVLFLIPGESMTDTERDNYAKLHPEVDFDTTNPLQPLDIVATRLSQGIEIIAGRGNTAAEVRNAHPNLHVVEIPITAYDVIRSINTTDPSNKTIAVITNNADIIGLQVFANLYNIRLLNYLLTPFDRIRDAIRDAVSRGADFVMGGSVTRVAAQEMGVPVFTFLLGPESMQNAFKEVKQVQATIEIEAARQSFLKELMDNILEGVVAVDGGNTITSVNAVAERLLGRARRTLVGKAAAELHPSFILEGKTRSEELIALRGNSVMLHRIPIPHHNRHVGAIFTLHESAKIETMGNSIRREMYAKEHVVRYRFTDVLGESAAVRQAMEEGRSYARTESNILITGESGSGKEVFAQSIHHASLRRNKPFVAINCAALPKELLQSELFGYVEGAFTGALRKGKAGLFEIAHGGTIFLDEIGEMDYANQGNLLRVLQERYVVRLGSHKPIPIDARVIAATNKKLTQLVAEGTFREDLYYRLNVLALEVPPLRKRGGDCILLMLYFLNLFPSPWQGDFSLEEDARRYLREYTWPGNIRELCNVAERLVATAKGPVIARAQLQRALLRAESPVPEISQTRRKVREARGVAQKEDIERMIAACGGNLSEAARKLGINRSTLWRRMKRY